MGYIKGFVHGAVAGTLIGLWVAPQSGERTRAQLRAFGKAARGGVDAAQRTAKQVAPVVGGAASLAREELERRGHPGERPPVDGCGRLTAPRLRKTRAG
jgi:gas vesicle protein